MKIKRELRPPAIKDDRIGFKVSRDVKRHLQALADQQGLDLSDVVRMALTVYLKQHHAH